MINRRKFIKTTVMGSTSALVGLNSNMRADHLSNNNKMLFLSEKQITPGKKIKQVILSDNSVKQPLMNGKEVNKKTADKDILNLWGDQGKLKNDLFDRVYNIFTANNKASFSDLCNDPIIKRIYDDNNLIYLAGPMLGNISNTGVEVWMRTTRPSKVEVLVFHNGKGKKFGPVYSNQSTDLSARVKITGLTPSSQYSYKVLINDKAIDFPNRELVFHTPSNSKKEIYGRITFGSCYHRWGLGNMKQTNAILSRRPDAMLFLGDIAVQDKMANMGAHRYEYLVRDLTPAWQKLVATVPVYATWDDHDYMNNDLAGIPKGMTVADKQNIREVFKYAWINPYFGFRDTDGVNTHASFGPIDIIMVDNRYFRTGKKGSFLGDEQMRWLKERLLACEGDFIVVSCGTAWNDWCSKGKDSWGDNDPEGREEIYKFIEDHNIKGVLLISGDRHGARGFAIPRSNDFSFYDFGVASLGARVGPPVHLPEWTTQLYGLAGRFAFGEFTFEGTKKDPKVTFRLISDEEEILYETSFRRSELTPHRI